MKFPRWMSWLFLAFFAYILYLGNFSPRAPVDVKPPAATSVPSTKPQPEEPIAQHPRRGYPKLAEATNFNFWKSVVNPLETKIYQIEDITLGTGQAVGCGQYVGIYLRGTLSDGSSFDPQHHEEKLLEFTLGQAPYPALNRAISGMQQGGVRTARVPLSALKPAQDKTPAPIATALLHITLHTLQQPQQAKNSIPFVAVPLTASDTDSPITYCGDTITLDLQPVLADGSLGKTITKQGVLGSNQFSLAINRAVEGMQVGEARLVVAPIAYRTGNAAGKGLVTRITRTE